MSTLTEPSEYESHNIYLSEDCKSVFLAIGDRILKVRENSQRKVKHIGRIQNTYYWQDYVSLPLIQNVYAVLDRCAKKDTKVTYLNDYKIGF